MYSKHLADKERSSSLEKEVRKLKKVVIERSSVARIEGYANKVKKVADEKIICNMLSGHYVSGNPERHKFRDHDELLPK